MPRVIAKANLSRVFAGEGVTHVQIAALRVRSGAVVACDPLTQLHRAPFTVAIPSGDHPVVGVNGSDAVILVFAEGTPARWELAVLPGQDVSTLGPDQFFGYPVDSGFGSFMDAEAAKLFSRELDTFSFDAGVPDEIEDELFGDDPCTAHVIGTFRSGTGTVDNPIGYNVVSFPAGYGDGVYATWVGFDTANHPVCLLTDFAL
jgi:hypothetical protein